MPGSLTPEDKEALQGGDKIQLSIFTPPAGAVGTPGIMIVKKGDNAVVVVMKAHKDAF
jgi:hypothetical protein